MRDSWQSIALDLIAIRAANPHKTDHLLILFSLNSVVQQVQCLGFFSLIEWERERVFVI